MSELNFQKRSVDNIRPTASQPKILRAEKSNTLSRILGGILSFALAFLLYSLYQEYSGLSEEEFKKANQAEETNQGVNSLSSQAELMRTVKLEIEVSNGYTDEPIKVKTNKIAPYTDITFQIKKPDKSLYEFKATSKITGLAEIEIPEESLTKVGEYEISANADGYDNSNSQKFYLRAGKVSSEVSEIKASKLSEIVGKNVEVEVTLLDKYGNPIIGRSVALVSTRLLDDVIEKTTEETSEKGKIKFLVTSKTPGKSSLLALDKNQGITIEKKVDITFTEDPNKKVEKPGEASSSGTSNNSPAAPSITTFLLNTFIPKASAATEVGYYTIESPDKFTMDEEISIVIKAMSSSNNIVTDYTGKIKFSSTDPKALLPEEYTFTNEDKGEHIFKIKFGTEGGQSITVESSGNSSVKGEKQVIVEKAKNSETSELTKPEILSPPKALEGKDTTLSTSKVDIAGKADANTTVEIYDDTIKLGETLANDTGLFFYKTDVLVDGKHSFIAKSVNSAGDFQESDIVSVVIDTTNPIVLREALSISKKILMPDETTTIQIKTEPGLASARAIINNTAIPLLEKEDEAGTYAGDYIATEETGTFEIDIELKDEVSNPVTYSNQGQIVVSLDPETVDLANIEDDSLRPGGGYENEAYIPVNESDSSPNTGPKETLLFLFASAIIFSWYFFTKKSTSQNK